MGASNLAAKRAAKANRRKAIVAQKRKAEAAEGSMAGQVVRSAALPIHDCLITENLFDVGMGTLILTRGATVGPVFLAAFLLDTFCCGVKDVTLRSVSADQLNSYIDMVDDVTPLVSIDPSHARKLLRDLVQWSGSLGFRPHRDFATAERLFGQIVPHAGETTFEFGQGGKPLYMPGPTDSHSDARRHVEQLGQQLGPDGFHYIVPV
jgi:hypothetical protein